MENENQTNSFSPESDQLLAEKPGGGIELNPSQPLEVLPSIEPQVPEAINSYPEPDSKISFNEPMAPPPTVSAEQGSATQAVPQVRYAGFWIRFVAYIIDWFILFIINFVLSFSSSFFLIGNRGAVDSGSKTLAQLLLPIALGIFGIIIN